MKKIFKERPMPDDIEFKEKDYGKRANAFVAAAGIAAAAGPFTGMTIASKLNKSLDENDFVLQKDGALATAGGNSLGVNALELDDYVFGCRDGYEIVPGTREAFEGIKARFGEYGAREVFGKSFENAVTSSDIAGIARSGYKCVVIPVRSFLILKDEKIGKKTLRFGRLDKTIRKCKKNGIYAVLKLCDAPGFDSAGNDMSIFAEDKQALAHRNFLIKLWEKIGAHYKDEPAVLGYELLDTDYIDLDKYAAVYDSIVSRTEKALRDLGDSHLILLPGNEITAVKPVYKGDKTEKCVYCKPREFIDIKRDSFEEMCSKATADAKTETFTKMN